MARFNRGGDSSGDDITAETTDRSGARVVLYRRVWEEKILIAHPEMKSHLAAVLRSVSSPSHVEADPVASSRTPLLHMQVRTQQLAAGGRKLRAGASADHLRIREPKGPAGMDRVHIDIGPLSFAYADYDAEHDVLYLSVEEPEEGVGEDTPEGHVIRYSPGTKRVVGLTLMNPRRILERDGRITVSVPETVEKSADELGPLATAA